ncbi:MAG: hypothetical protein JWO84_278 [Parcubacteria group bacterium]|nr:hypothetical protein [Parcubacteria group bacterium]
MRAGLSVVLVGTALPAFAQTSNGSVCGSGANLGACLIGVIGFIDTFVVPLVFALAFIVFIWGIYSTFIAGGANEEKRQEGQKLVMYGLIGFFLMFAVWGLVNLLIGTFGFNGSARPGLPTFNPPGSSAPTANPFQTDSTSKPVGASCTSTSCGAGMECIAGTCEPFGTISAGQADAGTPIQLQQQPNLTPQPTPTVNSGDLIQTPPSPADQQNRF